MVIRLYVSPLFDGFVACVIDLNSKRDCKYDIAVALAICVIINYLKYMSNSSFAAMNEDNLASRTLCSTSARRDSISGLL